MKTILTMLVLLAIAAQTFAAGILTKDANNVPIQGFAPNGLQSALLTVAGSTVDLSKSAAFAVYSPIDCKIRFMATSSKAGSISEPVISGAWETYVVNKATPFVNISGCTGGNLRRM